MKRMAALMFAVLVTSVALGARPALEEEIAKLQGKWFRTERDQFGNTFRTVKEVSGNVETLSTYQGEQLVHSHMVDFDVERTADVLIFRYANMRITAGPNKGVVKDGPFAYLYQVKGDKWIVVHGMMNGDENGVGFEVWERVRDVQTK